MTREEIDNLWKDPRNRRWGLYYCKEDPRVIVPKSIKWMGWTVNAARPSAIPVVLLLTSGMAAPVVVAAWKGASLGVVMLALAVSVTGVCMACAYLASRRA
jgi:uncharacterized membrane protein